MLKNYLKTAYRNLGKHPGYSLINIGGLTVGIACCLLIFQYVAFEYSFDNFDRNASTIYRVNQKSEGESTISPLSGYALGPALAQGVPEVVDFARLHPEYNNAVVTVPSEPTKTFEEKRVYYADSSFFQMFTYPLVAGNPMEALTEPGTVLLSETTARKYFGSENPLGKTLQVTGWISRTYRVSGVFQDVPANSHLQFDMMLPISDLLQRSYADPKDAWNWTNFITYVQLRTDANPSNVEQKFTGVLRRHLEEVFGQADARILIQPLRDIHLDKHIMVDADIVAPKAVMGSYRTVYFFTIIGLITLLIALVNYINLMTARALNRAREVGVRKTIGARKGQLVIQFLCESGVTLLAAAILAVALADLSIPVVNTLAGVHLTNALWSSPVFWGTLFGLFCIATLLAGLYPAFILSSFRPVRVLKGQTGELSTVGGWLRRGLVVFQFAAAIVLLAGTVIVYTQLRYMRNMDLGINLKQVLTISSPRVLPEHADRVTAIATFTRELRRLPAVRMTATSSAIPGRGYAYKTVVRSAVDPSKEVTVAGVSIDTGFARLYGLDLVAGRGFNGISFPVPEDEPRPIIATETAIHAVGFDTPEEALGKAALTGRIVGVFKDFNWSSAHEARANVFFSLSPGGSYISVKVDTEHLPQTLASIKEIYTQLFPGNPFQYTFVDEQFDQQYQNDRRFARLFTVFAGLAIAIACLGLLGLTTFTAEQRTKEIGIRKVLGASVPNILGLLSKEFLMLVLMGYVFAVPVAWYVMHRWLQDFAYRIDIGPGIFLLAGGIAMLIASLTISWQAIRAALANPVEALRYE